jgi:hypothetical protein
VRSTTRQLETTAGAKLALAALRAEVGSKK